MNNIISKLNKKSLIISLFAIITVISLPLYNSITDKYLNSSLKQSAITYAVTRSINAAVSIIQESSVTVGVGIEGNLAIGQALDPINDATERFSDLLTLSLWTLGSEKIIYELSKLPLFTFIIILLAVLILFYNSAFLKNILMIFILIRLFLPFSALVSYYFNDYYFKPNITKNIRQLKPYTKKTESENIKLKNSYLEKFFNKFNDAKNSLRNIRQKAKFYVTHTEDIISAFLNLASLYLTQFLLNVVFLPLLLIYLIKNMKLE